MLLLVSGLVTVGLTAAYSGRLWLLTFFGDPRGVTGDVAADPSPAMRWPLLVLAVPAAGLGFAFLARPGLAPGLQTTGASLLAALAGFALVYGEWVRDRSADPARALGPLRRPLERGLYADELYHLIVVRPVVGLVQLVRAVDVEIGASVAGTGRTARQLGGGLRRSQAGNVQSYLTALLAGVVLIVVAVAVGH
jgi:NADH-quinone oxidoreductase subunit L